MVLHIVPWLCLSLFQQISLHTHWRCRQQCPRLVITHITRMTTHEDKGKNPLYSFCFEWRWYCIDRIVSIHQEEDEKTKEDEVKDCQSEPIEEVLKANMWPVNYALQLHWDIFPCYYAQRMKDFSRWWCFVTLHSVDIYRSSHKVSIFSSGWEPQYVNWCFLLC